MRTVNFSKKFVRFLSTSQTILKQEDIVSNLYLKQIRDIAAKQKAANGSLVKTSPELKKQLDDQLNRLAQKFKLTSADVVGKLPLDFEKPALESSVAAVTQHRSIDELIAEVKQEEASYRTQREQKLKAEKERKAALSAN